MPPSFFQQAVIQNKINIIKNNGLQTDLSSKYKNHFFP